MRREMASAGFSSAVLHGMLRRGLDQPAIAEIVALPLQRVKAILEEKARLSFRQLEAIEQFTGLTDGELAALHVEPQGGSFTELATTFARLRCKPLPKRRNNRKKAG
jgi:hypothetical protein